MINESILLEMGFEKIPHYTVTNALIYNIKRSRFLNIGCVGSPNETMWICQYDKLNHDIVTDLICIHNYNYDGYLSYEKLNNILNFFKWKYPNNII